MIKCKYCGNEVECNKCRHNKFEDGSYEAITYSNANCICLQCFINHTSYDGVRLLHMVGCWNKLTKEEMERLEIAMEL